MESIEFKIPLEAYCVRTKLPLIGLRGGLDYPLLKRGACNLANQW